MDLKRVEKDYEGMKIYSYKKEKEMEYKRVGKYEYDVEKIVKTSLESCEYCLVEERSEYYKCMFDLDYKPNYDEKYLLENKKITEYIIEKIENALKKISTGSLTLNYILLKKNKGLGVHLIYPYLIINSEIHMKIYKEIMNEITKEKKYDLGIMEKIIDKGVIQSLGIRLPYNVSMGEYYYPIIEESTYIFDDEESKEEHIKECLINTKCKSSNIELKIIIDDDEELKDDRTKEYNEIEYDMISNLTMETFETYTPKYDLNKINEIANIINIKYLDDYNYWKRICWSLRYLGNETKEIARGISKKSNKYSINGFEKIWNDYNPSGITDKTLYHYAKESNKICFVNTISEFNEKDTDLEKYKKIINIIKEGQLTIAEHFCENHKDEIVYSNEKWYMYDEKIKIWNEYSSKQINFVRTKYAQFIRKEISDCITICNNKNMNEELKFLSTEKQKCTNANFANQTSTYFAKLLNNPEFHKKMNCNKKIICFLNGALELDTGIFREITKTDYITFTLQYNYEIEKANEQIENEIDKEFLKILNDDYELLKFNYEWMGYCITGESKLKKFLFLIGHTANNGKSTMAMIYQKVFREYFTKIDRKTFNEDYSKSHKQLITILYKRYIYIEELDQKMR